MILQVDALGLFSDSWSDQEFWVEGVANELHWSKDFFPTEEKTQAQVSHIHKMLQFWSCTGTFPFIIHLMQVSSGKKQFESFDPFP